MKNRHGCIALVRLRIENSTSIFGSSTVFVDNQNDSSCSSSPQLATNQNEAGMMNHRIESMESRLSVLETLLSDQYILLESVSAKLDVLLRHQLNKDSPLSDS